MYVLQRNDYYETLHKDSGEDYFKVNAGNVNILTLAFKLTDLPKLQLTMVLLSWLTNWKNKLLLLLVEVKQSWPWTRSFSLI